jgi:hypothetical protein
MASRLRLRRAARVFAAAALLTGAALLSGCSSVIDHIPTAVGGLPDGVPARPAEPPPYPAVHDMPPARGTPQLSDAEKKLLKDDLAATRDRTIKQGADATTSASTEATGTPRNP